MYYTREKADELQRDVVALNKLNISIKEISSLLKLSRMSVYKYKKNTIAYAPSVEDAKKRYGEIISKAKAVNDMRSNIEMAFHELTVYDNIPGQKVEVAKDITTLREQLRHSKGVIKEQVAQQLREKWDKLEALKRWEKIIEGEII